MRSITLFLSLFSTALAATTPPAGALVVGAGGQYKTVQSAVTAASSGKTIFIHAGTYNEQVYIPADKKNLVIIGASDRPDSHDSNKVTITQGLAQDSGKNNDQTGTLRAWGDGLKVYNVNFVNSRGKGSQALALSAYGDDMGFYGCQFKGFQDTVLSERGKHVFAKSLIQGATDFIFGMHAQTWFENCDIKVLNEQLGYVTANGRDTADNPSFYVINNSEISGTAPNGAFYLGRPWRQYSRVVFQNTKMSGVINHAGWHEWQKSEPRTSNVYYGEYKNSGSGAGGPRAGFAKTLSSPVSIGSVLGNGYEKWVDMKYMGQK